jgi:predicted O-methyltransferase YrrM
MLFSALISFYLKAKSSRQLKHHFLRTFAKEVLDDDRYYYSFDLFRTLKASLLQKEEEIEVLDLGAGSRKNNSNRRKIKEIAKTSVSPDWQCQQLYYMIRHFQPKTILEMGTSLGMSSLYMHAAAPKAQLLSLEGSPEIAQRARQHFQKCNAQNIQLLEGEFSQTLPQALEQIQKLDFAFLDGNHQKAPTLAYFEACLPYLHEGSVLVFDDIYWSKEMKSAWEELKARPEVSFSIDLFWAGLLFFKPLELPKKDWKLISNRYRPW